MRDGDSIVITGASAWCSLGFGRQAILEAMVAGEVAIDAAPAMEHRHGEHPQAAQAKETGEAMGCVPDRAERLIGRVVEAALSEASVVGTDVGRHEVIFGTTLGCLRHVGEGLRTDGLDHLARATTASLTASSLNGLGVRAGGSTVSAACASGLTTIMLAATALELGEVDLVVAIGYDPISEFAHAGFSSLRLIAEGPIRPFTVDREGMRVGEGAAALVLERASMAAARGAVPIATLLGVGASSDAHHLTQPEPSGAGAARALAEATDGVVPEVVFAHATSTPANDSAEYHAMRSALGDAFSSTPVTALKSRIGHTLGAAGAVETVIAIAAMEAGVIPPPANAQRDPEEFPELDLLIEPRQRSIDRAAIVSLGFGGADAAIQIGRGAASVPPRRAVETEEIVITGVGTLLPEDGEVMVDDARFAGLDDAREVRRIARFSRLVRGAGTLAARSAGLDDAALAASIGVVASRFGAVGYTLDYYEEIVRDGLGAGNPLLFAESVPNIGSAQLSLGLGLKEATIAVGGTRTAGIEAFDLARRQLVAGVACRAIVVAAEEADTRLMSILSRLGMLPASPGEGAVAEGAVAFVLERASEALSRGATPLACLGETRIDWPKADSSLERRRALERVARWARRQGDRLPRRSLASTQPVEAHSVGPLATLAQRVRCGGSRAVVLSFDEAGGVGGIALT